MRSIACGLLVIAALVSLALAASTTHCYSGSIAVDAERQLDFSFSLLPSAPTRVLHSSFVLDGQIVGAGAEPKLGCETTGELASISIAFATHSHLTFNFETTDDCATVMANLDSPGIFKGTAHELDGASVLHGAPLDDFLVRCGDSTCVQLNYTTGPIVLAGEAFAKSPCGAEGVDSCTMEIVFKTTGECSPGATAATVYDVDVFIQPDGVALSSFQPASLANAQLLCANSELTLQADGVMIVYPAPTDNTADCPSLLADLSVLASRTANLVVVALSDDELWQAQSAPSIRKATTPATGQNDGAGGDDVPVEPTLVNNASSISRPVMPTLNCSMRYDYDNVNDDPSYKGYCCSVYGYHNPNPVAVVIPRVIGSGWFLPATHVYGFEPITFPANTTVDAAFGVIWPCHQFIQHFKTWSLKTRANFDNRVWERQVVANRERQDCSDAVIAAYCTVSDSASLP